MVENSSVTIAFACDHGGFSLKNKLIKYCTGKGYIIKDFGTFSEESCDYPDFGHKMAEAVGKSEFKFGISICKTGNGINITANKHKNVRSALCWEVELALLARQHNNANVCALPGQYVSYEKAIEIIEAFLHTSFEGGRHLRRVNKISQIN